MFKSFFRGGLLASLLGVLATQTHGQRRPAALVSPARPAVELRYLQPEQLPRLPGGKDDPASFEAAVRAHLRYQQPAGQLPFGPNDLATLCFTVGADGRVRDVRILSKLEPGFEQAVLAAAGQLPRLVPGQQEGQPVAVRYTLLVGAAGPYAGNRSSSRGGVLLPPAWPELDRYASAPPRLPGNVGLRTALDQRLLYPPANSKSRFGDRPVVGLAFTVDAQGRATDALVTNSGGLAYDRAAVAALAALPPFEPYRGIKGPTAVRLETDVSFPPRPVGYRPVVSNQLPPDPPVYSPEIVPSDRVEVWPGTNAGGRYYLNDVVQGLVVLPPEVAAGTIDGLVLVEAVVGLSGRVYGLRVRQPLSAACDSAALAAVRRLPLLTPGQYRGQTVAVQLTFALHFWGPQHLYAPNEAPHAATFAGPPDLENYLRANLRVPDSLRQTRQPRYVEVLAVVQANGQVGPVQLTRPTRPPNPALDEEALRLVRTLPAWQPARDRQNQPVASQIPLILRFPPAVPVVPPTTLAAAPAAPVVRRPEPPEPVYTYVEQMPELLGGGGRPAIQAALQQRFHYPAAARSARTQGTIEVSFVVGTDGRAGLGTITKSLSAATDQAALAAVRALPRFVPGRQSNRVVLVSYTLPITVTPPVGP